MKRLEISRLMDEYVDGEFFPEGGAAADIQAVKDRVLAQAAQEEKRRMPRRKKMLLAAALVAVLAVLVGAGFPYMQHRLATGTLSFEQTSSGWVTSFLHNREVMELEDGRLYFNQDDGQRVDVTDLMSEETPYIYDGSDPDNGMRYYIIMGGTPESYGCLEWVQTPYPFDDVSFNFDENGNPVSVVYALDLYTPGSDEPDNQQSITAFETGLQLDDPMNPPWLLAAVKRLGIPYWVPSEDEENVYVRAQS